MSLSPHEILLRTRPDKRSQRSQAQLGPADSRGEEEHEEKKTEVVIIHSRYQVLFVQSLIDEEFTRCVLASSTLSAAVRLGCCALAPGAAGLAVKAVAPAERDCRCPFNVDEGEKVAEGVQS